MVNIHANNVVCSLTANIPIIQVLPSIGMSEIADIKIDLQYNKVYIFVHNLYITVKVNKD